MATLSKFQKKVIAAVTGYEKGSAKLVRVFEEAVEGYHVNYAPENLAFFINALSNHKVLQKAAVSILKPFGKFNIEQKGGVYVITNNGKMSAEQKAKAAAKFAEFKAKELTSFLQDKKIERDLTFVLDAKMKTFESSLRKLLVDAMANDEDPALVVTRLQNTVKAMAKADLSSDVAKRKKEIAELKAAQAGDETPETTVETTPSEPVAETTPETVAESA